MPQQSLQIQAATAAKWWADQLLAAQPHLATQMGAEPDSPMNSPMGAVMAVLAQAQDRADDPTKVEAFRAALEARILTSLERYPSLAFGVDYHPDRILSDAADDAGMPLGMTTLPWKTTMWVDDRGVRVSKGYGAASEDVPLVQS